MVCVEDWIITNDYILTQETRVQIRKKKQGLVLLPIRVYIPKMLLEINFSLLNGLHAWVLQEHVLYIICWIHFKLFRCWSICTTYCSNWQYFWILNKQEPICKIAGLISTRIYQVIWSIFLIAQVLNHLKIKESSIDDD